MTREFDDQFARRTRWNLDENSLSRAVASLRTGGTPFLDLARSNPTECGFNYDQQGILRAFAQSEISHYVPDPRGLSRAREAVSGYYAGLQSPVSAGDVVLTSGTSEGYSFVFRLLCNPGDEVLIPSPGYPLFDFLADLCDVRLVRYPLFYDHGWQIDLPALAATASSRTRGLIVVHPNNPTGHYTSESERARLADFCVQHGIALIADEVFLDFSLKESR